MNVDWTPADEAGWWMAPTEGYWQALLEQGEIAPDTCPPAEPEEIFASLGMEASPGLTGVAVVNDLEEAAALANHWHTAERALEHGDRFTLTVTGANRGGLLVAWNGLQGFVPASHLIEMPVNSNPQDRIAELSRHIGESVTARLIEVDAQQNRLVFSQRAAQSEFRSPSEVLEALGPGDTCQGTVTNLTAFGAFVDLGGVEGLIHISEISWDRVQHPGDVLRPGQPIEVYVLGVNPEEERIALSLKQMRPNPWLDLDSRFRVGQVIEGTVTNVVSFGAFVRVEEGVEGLIHVSELGKGSFPQPRNAVREGEQVQVRVLNVDPERHRLGLSLRQAGHAEG
jgi:small subunit ribosomal protein S1